MKKYIEYCMKLNFVISPISQNKHKFYNKFKNNNRDRSHAQNKYSSENNQK